MVVQKRRMQDKYSPLAVPALTSVCCREEPKAHRQQARMERRGTLGNERKERKGRIGRTCKRGRR